MRMKEEECFDKDWYSGNWRGTEQ